MSLDKAKAAKKQVVGVLLDVGNSETRVKIKFKPVKGLEHMYLPCEQTFALSNHYCGLESTYNIAPDYMTADTTILDIDGMRVAHGELVDREFVGRYEFPTGKSNKSSEPITLWTLHRVLLEVYRRLRVEWEVPADEDLDIAFSIFILVPPDEHEFAKDEMVNLIAGIDQVVELVPVGDEVHYRSVPYPVICEDIQVFPEGVTAFMGVRTLVQGYKLLPNPDMDKYTKGYALVIDIGAGTTDLAILQDGKLKSDSRMSIPDAGNHITSALLRNVKSNPRLRGRLALGIQNIGSVMNEAMIREGDGLIEEDCAAALNAAKEELASSLANQIKNYANSLNVIAMVKGILVVGGANAQAVRDGEVVSPALETFLIPKIKQFAELAELIPVRNRDTRYLNLDGLESLYITYQARNSANKGAQ